MYIIECWVNEYPIRVSKSFQSPQEAEAYVESADFKVNYSSLRGEDGWEYRVIKVK